MEEEERNNSKRTKEQKQLYTQWPKDVNKFWKDENQVDERQVIIKQEGKKSQEKRKCKRECPQEVANLCIRNPERLRNWKHQICQNLEIMVRLKIKGIFENQFKGAVRSPNFLPNSNHSQDCSSKIWYNIWRT